MCILHYCDYRHPLTTQLTINQHDAPCPAPGYLGGCGRQWPRESVTFEANQNCSRLFPSVEKIFSQRGKLVGNYVSCCCGRLTVTASRSPRVSPTFLVTESRHIEQTGRKMSRLQLLVTAGHCMIMPGWMCGVKCKMCKLQQLLVSIAPLHSSSSGHAVRNVFSTRYTTC